MGKLYISQLTWLLFEHLFDMKAKKQSSQHIPLFLVKEAMANICNLNSILELFVASNCPVYTERVKPGGLHANDEFRMKFHI